MFGMLCSLHFRVQGFTSISSVPKLFILTIMLSHFLPKNIFFFSSISSLRPPLFHILPTRYYHDSQIVPVSVWWDFENCHPPPDLHVLRIPHYIRDAVRGKGILGPLHIKAFGDVYQLTRSSQEALVHTGINIIHVPKGGKNSADRSLLIDLLLWASQNPPPAHLLVISGDRDFAEVLHRLRMNNYNILIAGTKTSHLLCNVATIVWRWHSLCRGENFEGVHYNHPPEGFYDSWRGQLDAPFEDNSSDGKQFVHSETVAFPKPISGLKVRPVPKEVLQQLYQILNLYPNGIQLACLGKELQKAGVCLDKDYYGYKSLSCFLSSMVQVYLQVTHSGGFIVYYNPKKSPESDNNTSERSNTDDKYSEPSKEEPDVGCVIGGSTETQRNTSSRPPTFLGWIKSWWPFRKKVGNTHDLAVHRDEMVSIAKDTGISNLEQRVSHSVELQSFKQRQMASQFKEPELSEARQTVNHSAEQRLFSNSTFWKQMGSFIFTSKGALLVLYSRSRKEMALSFKKYGPDVLRSLCDNDLLQLVDLLISTKKWLEERPSQTYPFRAIPFNTPESNLQKSVECEADKKESIPLAAGYSPTILKDVKKLVREILRQYPDGCNMGMIPKLFVEKYGYHLDIGKLGYSKLSLLMQTLPGVRTEYEYIYPLNHGKCDSGKETSILKTQETKLNVVHHASENEFHPHTGDDQKDYQWEESGPISASNSNETDLELKPRHEAIELKTAIVPNYESDLSDDEFPESGEDHSCVTLSEHGHFLPVDHDICDSSKETSIIKSQETKLNDLGHHPSEDEFSLYSKDDQKDHQWDELGPVSASNSSETTDLELEPRHEAIKLKTAIDPNYEPDLSDDGILESGEHNSCLTQSEYDHSVPADHGICDSGKETSILETHDTKLNDVVHHNSEDDFDDLHSEDGQKDYPLEELGPVSVSNCNKTDLESKPRQEAIELQTVLDPDYEPNLSDDNSSESGGDESCLNQPEEEGELKHNVEDNSLQNPDSTYGNQEQEDGINPNKANAEGNCVTDDLNNPPRISIPATISGILLGGYEGNHMPKKNCSFNTEPASPKNKELIEGILKCLKPTDGTKMPN